MGGVSCFTHFVYSLRDNFMEEILIFAIVGLLVGFSKGGLGGPVPVALTVPLLSTVIAPQQAVGLILPLLMFADVFALYFYWNEWDKRYILLMLIPGLIGVAFGTFILKDLDAQTLKRIIGAFTLTAVSFKILSDRLQSIQYKPRDWHGWLAGWASGFGSALANVGAPPFTAYLLLQSDTTSRKSNLTPKKFIGTSTLFFAVINLTKLPGFIAIGVLDVNRFLSIAWVLLIIPPTIALVRSIITRINQKTFEWFMMIPLLILSIWLLFFS
jgi:uncharacterized protein